MGEHGAVPCAACGGAVFLMRIKENFLLNGESDSSASSGHTHHVKIDAGGNPESATPTWRPKEPMRSEQEGHPEHFQDLTANQTSFTAVVFGRPERAALPAPSPWQPASHLRSVTPHYRPCALAPRTAATREHFYFIFFFLFSLRRRGMKIGNKSGALASLTTIYFC